MDEFSVWSKRGSWYMLLFCLLLMASSIVNLGYFASACFILLSVLILKSGPQMGFIYLIASFYLPNLGLNIPRIFLVSTILVILFNFRYIFSLKGYVNIRSMILCFIVFSIMMALTGFYIPDRSLYSYSLTFLFYTIAHVVCCNNLVNNGKDIDFCLKWWGILGALGAVVGYIHFSLQGQVYLTSLVDTDITGKVNLSIHDRDQWVRWIVAGAEPNYVGLNLLIPVGINFYYLTKKVNIYNIFLALVCYLGLFGTFSRSSFLASLVLVLLFVLFSKMSNKPVIILGGIGLTFIIINFFPDFVDRINTIQDNIEYTGGAGRFERWGIALKLWSNNPIMGIGLGQISHYSPTHDVSHNTFLNILAEGGVLAFVPFITMCIIYLIYAFRDFRKTGTTLFFIIGVAYFFNLNTVTLFDYRVMISLFMLLFIKINSTKSSYQFNYN